MVEEKAKRKWKPMFDCLIIAYPNINEEKFVTLCEKVATYTPAAPAGLFENYYDKINPDWELAKIRLKEVPHIFLIIKIACRTGIFDYEQVYENYCEFIDVLKVEDFFNYNPIEKYINKYIRKTKLKTLI